MNARDREQSKTGASGTSVERGSSATDGEGLPSRKPYRRPTIRDYGSVGQLTAGASGMGSDGVPGGMFNN